MPSELSVACEPLGAATCCGRRRGGLLRAAGLGAGAGAGSGFDSALTRLCALPCRSASCVAAALLRGAQRGLALLERRPGGRQGLLALGDRRAGRLHPLDRGLDLVDVGARGGAEVADPADHAALVVLDALEVERPRRQVVDVRPSRGAAWRRRARRCGRSRRAGARARRSRLVSRRFVSRQRIARVREVASSPRRASPPARRAQPRPRPRAGAAAETCPSRAVDGGVLLRELGADLVLLGRAPGRAARSGRWCSDRPRARSPGRRRARQARPRGGV